MVDISLSYGGSTADDNAIDLYDVARGIAGFQRSLALTTHLVINGEIITQAPYLKGAKILTAPAEEGSWKITATIIAGMYTLATAPKDTPFGHLIYSAYDYVVSETLGFHIEYDKSLFYQYQEQFEKKKITREKFDSLIEKSENSILDMHRPIYSSGTATKADITARLSRIKDQKIGPQLTSESYDYLNQSNKSDKWSEIDGFVSSYNSNTYKGRIFSFTEGRPIPFELANDARTRTNVLIITTSLRANAISRGQQDKAAAVRLKCFRIETQTGRLKALYVTEVFSA